jgi:hypothetical protein
MFLFGLRDHDLVAQVLKLVAGYMAALLVAFILPSASFYLIATAATCLSAGLIVAEVAKRYPAISFGERIARSYAFPRNRLHRRISYYYAVVGIVVSFLPALLFIGGHSGSLGELRSVWPALFFLAIGYPGVVNLFLLWHPVSRAEESESGASP